MAGSAVIVESWRAEVPAILVLWYRPLGAT